LVGSFAWLLAIAACSTRSARATIPVESTAPTIPVESDDDESPPDGH
jgi:hypothetical protein